MDTEQKLLAERAFGADAESLITVAYRAHEDGLKSLAAALRDPRGVALLRGPAGAGKTMVVNVLARKLGRGNKVALVDGNRLKPRALLTSMLDQFGEGASTGFDDELLKMVGAFAAQYTRTYQPPILIVDNADRMFPSTLRVLNALAAITVQQRFALRIVLTGHDGLQRLISSAGMSSLAERDTGMHTLKPLTAKETMIYLHARLEAAGREPSETTFPFDVCDRLREQSGGWPGTLNHFALEAMSRAQQLPISVVDTYAPSKGEKSSGAAAAPVSETSSTAIPVLEAGTASDSGPPRLAVSRNGALIENFRFKDKKVLIGRSEFADIVIADEYSSKMHAVLLLYADALVLLDLNSANGTTVNSVRVRSTILKDDDIIAIGHHRLKVANAPAMSPEMQRLLAEPDTLKMKNLIDARREKAQRNIRVARDRESRG